MSAFIVCVSVLAIVLGSDDATDATRLSTIVFKSGNALQAKVVSESVKDGRTMVVVQTSTGAVFELDKGKVIKSIRPPSAALGLYDAERARMQNTADEHWRMYKWCKSNGGSAKLRDQMKFHLRQIVKIDPSDESAWQLQGYVEHGNRWIPEAQHYASLGYVKVDGKWIPELQASALKMGSANIDFLGRRKKALAKWKRNILGKKHVDVVRGELFKIVDPVSLSFFHDKFVTEERDVELLSLYLEAIGRVESPIAQKHLVTIVIEYKIRDIREFALTLLEQNHFDSDLTVKFFTRYLGSSNNRFVNRAGRAIGIMNRNSGIIPLIGALQTKHKVSAGDNGDRISTGFDSNGGIGFTTGSTPPRIELLDNEYVLEALENVTGERFGYDATSWKQWYITEHTISEFDFRHPDDP